MTRTSSLEVSIKTHINCTLNIFACFHACFALLCMYCVLIAPSVDILCIFTTVFMVAYVNLILKKMMMMVMCRIDALINALARAIKIINRVINAIKKLIALVLLPSLSHSEWSRYCVARRPSRCVCVCHISLGDEGIVLYLVLSNC